MEYRVITRGFELSDAMKTYIDRKLEKVDRVLREDDVTSMEIRIEKDAENYVVKIILNMRGEMINVEERNSDVYTAIDFVSDALEKRVKKAKDKMRVRHKSGVRGLAESMLNEVKAEEEEDKIVSEKRLPLLQMDLEEALLQMETMDHMFLVFRNIDTGEINLLFRKDEKKYGLIEFYE